MRHGLGAAVLAALLLAAGCGGSTHEREPAATGGAPAEALTLQLDWFANADHVGIYAALDRGLFAARGLDVHARPPSDVSDAVKLVAAGRADLGISYQPDLVFAQAEEIPVVAVAALVPRALNSVIARGDAGVAAPADLAGKTIGEDGSASTAAYLDAVLEHAGLDPRADVKRVKVGFSLAPALLAGRVDAVIGVFQNIEGVEFRRRGLEPAVFPVDENGVPGYDELVVIANADRLADDAAYRGAVRRFVAALAAGTSWARAHPAAAADVLAAHIDGGDDELLAATVRATLRLLRPAPGNRYGQMDPQAWDDFARWMHDRGLVDAEPDGAALTTNDYLPRP
jgi:putative hydroxymethylpyrimidine transport system substrate-binding protein